MEFAPSLYLISSGSWSLALNLAPFSCPNPDYLLGRFDGVWSVRGHPKPFWNLLRRTERHSHAPEPSRGFWV
eukprot:2009541-Prymnesium_polylepis.1